MEKPKLYPSKFVPVYNYMNDGTRYVSKYVASEYDTEENIKANCKSCQLGTPVDHFGSSYCKSGGRSIAAGGSNTHCTCDSCF